MRMFELGKHDDCTATSSLVGVWVILDRPPNDPFLRKKEPLTSSFRSAGEKGRGHTGGRLRQAHVGIILFPREAYPLRRGRDSFLSRDEHVAA